MTAPLSDPIVCGQKSQPDGIRLKSLSKFSQDPKRPSVQHHILWIKSGPVEAILNKKKLKLCSPTLISVPPEYAFELQTQPTGVWLTLSQNYLDRITWQLEGLIDPIHYWEQIISGQILNTQHNRIAELFDQIELEFSGNHIYREPALYGNTTLLIVEMARLLNLQSESTPTTLPQKGQAVFKSFQSLVEAHFNEHWKISQYASALDISERALRRLCKSISGLSPNEILQQRIVVEAKRNLLFSKKTVTEICYELGFSDPSHFTKYFSNSQGLSPSVYRSQQQYRLM